MHSITSGKADSLRPELESFRPIRRGSTLMVHESASLTRTEITNLESVWGRGGRGYGQISHKLFLKVADETETLMQFADLERMHRLVPNSIPFPATLVYSATQGFKGQVIEYIPGRQ
ncbi:MAG: hypothetical protein KGH66_02505, partial [Candidatus Micrarchaeota archaeon]|nr:hypothetical protein [Candidatus Micrarchaeota archaeon]